MLKNFKKILTIIFIIIFIFWFSYFFWNDYKSHYEEIKKQQISKNLVLEKANNFTLKNVKDIENLNLYYTPYKNLLNKLVEKIEKAKKNVYLEVYILTEKRLQNALIKAKNSWIDVKVILEKNPYRSPNLNKKAYDFLKSKWVNVVYSNTNNFSLNHSKMILIDDEIFLSTGNFTYWSFVYNREFMLFLKNKDLYDKLKKIFLWDYNWKLVYVYDDNLILSPEYSRIIFEKIFSQSKKELKMYFPYLNDEELLNLLIEKKNLGIDISMILWPDSSGDELEIERLQKAWIKVKILKKPKVHAKAILVDNEVLYIWSINFSKYSLDFNREIGIIFRNKEVIGKFLKVFYNDFYTKK